MATVLAVRDSDDRVVVEVRNAQGVANRNMVWFRPGYTPIDMVAVPDKDSDGIPEAAVLFRRDSDGRHLVEVRNAQGPVNPSTIWLAPGIRMACPRSSCCRSVTVTAELSSKSETPQAP